MLGMSAWGSRRKGPMSLQIPGKFYRYIRTATATDKCLGAGTKESSNSAEIHQETTPPTFPP